MRIRIFFNLVVFLSVMHLSFLFADEMGLSGGLMTLKSGSIKTKNVPSMDLESTGMPLSLYFLSDNFRISYWRYEQFAEGDDGTYYYQARVSTNVLAFLYQGSLSDTSKAKEERYYDFKTKSYKGAKQEIKSGTDMYWNAGIGIFRTTVSGVSSSRNRSLIDPGLIIGFGYKKYVRRSFYGFEINHLYKTTTTESKYTNNVEIQVNDLMISFITGVTF